MICNMYWNMSKKKIYIILFIMCRELGCILYNCILTVIIMSTIQLYRPGPINQNSNCASVCWGEFSIIKKNSVIFLNTTNKLKHALKIDWKYKPWWYTPAQIGTTLTLKMQCKSIAKWQILLDKLILCF